MRKKFKTKKKMIPYLCEVLNRSRFDGEPICYSVKIGEKEATISFEQEIPGNLYHQKVIEAYNLREERKNKLSMPILSKAQAERPEVVKKVKKKYSSRNYMVGNM